MKLIAHYRRNEKAKSIEPKQRSFQRAYDKVGDVHALLWFVCFLHMSTLLLLLPPIRASSLLGPPPPTGPSIHNTPMLPYHLNPKPTYGRGIPNDLLTTFFYLAHPARGLARLAVLPAVKDVAGAARAVPEELHHVLERRRVLGVGAPLGHALRLGLLGGSVGRPVEIGCEMGDDGDGDVWIDRLNG